jgi:hypothetical protein
MLLISLEIKRIFIQPNMIIILLFFFNKIRGFHLLKITNKKFLQSRAKSSYNTKYKILQNYNHML